MGLRNELREGRGRKHSAEALPELNLPDVPASHTGRLQPGSRAELGPERHRRTDREETNVLGVNMHANDVCVCLAMDFQNALPQSSIEYACDGSVSDTQYCHRLCVH